MSALGYQIWSIVTKPTLLNVAIFLIAVAGWLAVTLGAQALISTAGDGAVFRAQRSMDATQPIRWGGERHCGHPEKRFTFFWLLTSPSFGARCCGWRARHASPLQKPTVAQSHSDPA